MEEHWTIIENLCDKNQKYEQKIGYIRAFRHKTTFHQLLLITYDTVNG